LAQIMVAASRLSIEKRAQFLQRLAAKLNLLGAFTDRDLDAAISLSLVGLIHHPEPAA
jgi:hypothetical protein